MARGNGDIRIAAMADIHYGRNSAGMLLDLFSRMHEMADVLLLCGDLTDYGLEEEASVLARDLNSVKIPMIGVLGNHDFESDKEKEVVSILRDAGVTMLDGDATEVHGVGFAGVKGFGGGFGRRALGPWGEKTIKSFVQEALDEALKLEAALARLRTSERVVLLHYSPIQATAVGEPPEIMPFLGSSRLEEPLIRYRASVVFHGHAHHGSPEGRTKSDIPVYNVCYPLLKRLYPDQPPLRIHTIRIPAEVPA
jgi:Icc-related predicted phosphoesterase